MKKASVDNMKLNEAIPSTPEDSRRMQTHANFLRNCACLCIVYGANEKMCTLFPWVWQEMKTQPVLFILWQTLWKGENVLWYIFMLFKRLLFKNIKAGKETKWGWWELILLSDAQYKYFLQLLLQCEIFKLCKHW